MTAIRLLVARLRQDPVPSVLLVALVAATALLAASAPRLLNRAADAGLRHELSEAAPVERNLQFGRITRIDALPEEGLGPVAAVSDEIEHRLPASLRATFGGKSMHAESVEWVVPDSPPIRPGFLSLRVQDVAADQIRLVEGREPTGESSTIEAPPPPPSSVPPDTPGQARLFEVMLSARTAAELGVDVGDRLFLVTNPDDPLVGPFGVTQQAAIDVVGLYELAEPDGDYWLGDYALDQPTMIPVGLDIVEVHATALLSPDAYAGLLQFSYPMRYAFRFQVDPDRLDAGGLDGVVVDLRRIESDYATFATSPDPTRTTLQTALPDLLASFLAERRSAEAILATAAIGPAAVALTAIGMLALLGIRRRRRALVLIRGRGGSSAQLTLSHLAEGILLTGAPAAVGALAATQVVEGRSSPLSFAAAGLVALGTVIVIVAVSLPTALASLRGLEREAPPTLRASPRRLAFEALVVVLAVGGVVLLRKRGLAGGSAAGDLAGVDPFLAAVPALVGVAVALVVIRLYPYPVRAAGLVAGGSRGLVPSLGLRRAERQAGGGSLPLVVLLLTVAIGTFSSAMLATIDRGQVDSSWQEVGAAHRVVSRDRLPESLDVTAIDGVEAVAGVHEADATVGIASGSRVALIAIDAPEYDEVTSGTPLAGSLPPALRRDAGAEPGTSANPVPAVVSSRLRQTSTTRLEVGDTFQLTVRSRFATFEVVEVRSQLPTIEPGREFIAVPRQVLSTALRDRPLPTTSLFVRASDAAADELRAAAGAAGSGISVLSRAEELESLRGAPLVQAVESGFAIALGAAVLYAGLAVIISLLMAGTARARETAHLRTLGLGRGQIIALTVLEHVPPVLVAVAAGAGLGIGVAAILLPGLGLATFVGSVAVPALTVDLGQLGVLVAVLAVVVAIGIGVAAWAQRRADPARAVREGIE